MHPAGVQMNKGITKHFFKRITLNLFRFVLFIVWTFETITTSNNLVPSLSLPPLNKYQYFPDGGTAWSPGYSVCQHFRHRACN